MGAIKVLGSLRLQSSNLLYVWVVRQTDNRQKWVGVQ
jgi:hypothetical protein